MKRDYLKELKEHLLNTEPSVFQQTAQGTVEKILADEDTVKALLHLYRQNIDEYGSTPEGAYVDAVHTVLGIKLYLRP